MNTTRTSPFVPQRHTFAPLTLLPFTAQPFSELTLNIAVFSCFTTRKYEALAIEKYVASGAAFSVPIHLALDVLSNALLSL